MLEENLCDLCVFADKEKEMGGRLGHGKGFFC
jgi:hypothetical protein